MSLDHSDTVGWPAAPTVVVKRRRRIPAAATSGLKREGQYKDPGTAEIGWLTPLRPSATGGYHWFACRCGANVVKQTRFVRKSHASGRVVRCSNSCTHREPKK